MRCFLSDVPRGTTLYCASKGRYGSRKMNASLDGLASPPPAAVSRRRAFHIMRGNGPVGACGRKRFKVHPGAVNEADVPNVVARGFGGRAPHPYMQRPDLRARRGLVELRLPARRPLQQGDRRPLRRAQEGRPAGQAGVRDALHPDPGHRGVPHGPRQRVRQRRDRPDARGLRHREVAIGQGLPLRQRRRRVDRQDTEGRARPP